MWPQLFGTDKLNLEFASHSFSKLVIQIKSSAETHKLAPLFSSFEHTRYYSNHMKYEVMFPLYIPVSNSTILMIWHEFAALFFLLIIIVS